MTKSTYTTDHLGKPEDRPTPEQRKKDLENELGSFWDCIDEWLNS